MGIKGDILVSKVCKDFDYEPKGMLLWFITCDITRLRK